MSDEDPDGVQSRSQLESRHQEAHQELQELRQRMDAIKQEIADEVDRRWVSPWRSEEMFDVKVSARLSSHEEYRSLLGQLREVELVEAALAKGLDHSGEEESA